MQKSVYRIFTNQGPATEPKKKKVCTLAKIPPKMETELLGPSDPEDEVPKNAHAGVTVDVKA